MSKKRKSFESHLADTMTGVFTRSRTRIFVHSNRSSRSRINNHSNNKTLADRCFSSLPNKRSYGKRRRNDLNTQCDELSPISVKDLRSHRVFSTKETQEFGELVEKSTDFGDRKEDTDCMQATPPEPEVAGCRYEDKDEELQKDEVVNDSGDKKPRVSPVPSPRARAKIYKFPGSLSYRRLLPSLMNVAKEISCIESNSDALLPVVTNQAKDGEKRCIDDPILVLNVGNVIENQVLMVEENGLAEDREAGRLTNCANQTVPLVVSLYDAAGNNSVHYRDKKEGDSNKAVDKAGFKNDLSMKLPSADKETGVTASKVECAVTVLDQVHGKASSRSVPRITKQTSDGKISRTGMGLKQCSRLKDSFAYRRLLPYLREINMDSSGLSSKGHCPKVDEKPQENAQTPLRSSSDVHGLNSENFQSRSDSMPQSTEALHALQEEAVLATSDHASEIDQSNGTTTHNNTEENELPTVKTPSNIDSHSEANATALISIDGGSPPKPLRDIVYSESPPKYPLFLIKHVSPAIKETLVTGASNGANAVDLRSMHDSSHSGPLNPINVLSSGSRKCILKRNPRGCRGPCSCLNCASFRLHAERAFEFSKHQMEDAEEVALDLISELSSLRSMLEESAVRPDCCQAYIKQVKEACEKASEAEELARTRISEMNYELDVHSRITCKYEPRVRFDNKVKVKLIP